MCSVQTQSFDQKFENMNKALLASCQKGLPVRVVRSHKVPFKSHPGTAVPGLFTTPAHLNLALPFRSCSWGQSRSYPAHSLEKSFLGLKLTFHVLLDITVADEHWDFTSSVSFC